MFPRLRETHPLLPLQAVTPAIPMPEEEELNMKFAELVVRKKQRNLAFHIANLKGGNGSWEFNMHRQGS